jgi:hypothetical protein
VADSQDDDLLAIVVIESDIGSLTKIDNPLTELGKHFFDRPTDLWMFFE